MDRMHYEIWGYYHSTSKVQANVLQNLRVGWRSRKRQGVSMNRKQSMPMQ